MRPTTGGWSTVGTACLSLLCAGLIAACSDDFDGATFSSSNEVERTSGEDSSQDAQGQGANGGSGDSGDNDFSGDSNGNRDINGDDNDNEGGANGDGLDEPAQKILKIDNGVARLCVEARMKTREETLSFARTTGQGCAVRDAKQGGTMTAHTMQTQKLVIPEDAVICGFELAANNDSFSYDDEFLMLFEGFFLAGANHTEEVLRSFGMQSEGDLVKWDWQSHYATKRDHDPGGCSGDITCQFPKTQQNGRVEIKVPSDWVDSLPIESLEKNEFELSTIATGNQNSGTDCSHSGLDFTVTLHYAE